MNHFSLGMKQSLGLAIALLSSPEILILDEPTNGLDPMGIMDLRNLLLKINKERNIAILISSHILGELFQLANCYGFIHDGKLIQEITLEKLKNKRKHYVSLKVDNVNKAIALLQNKINIEKVDVHPDNEIKIYDPNINTGVITKNLVRNDVIVYEITNIAESLENYYKQLINGGDYEKFN